MIYLDTNHDENETLFRCPECRKVLTVDQTCCLPAPFYGEIEAMTADEYRQHCERVRHASHNQ